MPGSVFSYLLLLTLVPIVCLVGVAAVPVLDAVGDVRVTRATESAMRRIRLLNQLWVSLTAETASATGAALGISVASMNRMTGNDFVRPLPQAQAATDALLAGLAAMPGGGSEQDRLSASLAGVRRQAGRPVGDGSFAGMLTGSAQIVLAYAPMLKAVAAAEKQAATDISDGSLGQSSARVLGFAAQLDRVTDLVIVETRRGSLVYALAAGEGDQAAQRRTLQQQNALADAAAGALDHNSRGVLAPSWRRFRDSPARTGFASLAARLAEDPAEGRPGAGSTAFLEVGRTGDAFNHLTNRLVTETVDGGLAAASGFRRTSTAHARAVIAGASASILVTILLLLAVGTAIRRRLRRLAESAQRLSSGHLDQVSISGPREVALAAQGLDDAARTLRRVLASAERLAAGDLDAPDLAEPVEGRLGAAVHAAVEQVALALQQRERMQQELTYRATHDSLTGLPNRAAAEATLAEEFTRARAEGREIAVLFVDLDQFKDVNDTHGHAAGDEVLRVVAERMSAELRSGDVLCRLGGDEFVVVAPGTSTAEALAALGERIVARVSVPVAWAAGHVQVGACVGVGVSQPDDTDVDQVLIRADQAVYRAKSLGRGRVSF